TGKVEAITVITRLKSLIDYELLYWGQFIEREKAVARLEAITAVSLRPMGNQHSARSALQNKIEASVNQGEK
ncbi:MAG: hypothetical protein Q7T83_07100, partial [Thermodesulfovibrionales bacterium]|nr:hypothetical protein [Thermodesulfovibrionales bacterium]